MVKLLDWQSDHDHRPFLDEITNALAQGQVVGIPTETVYGVAASSSVAAGVERLQSGKGRPEQKPLTLAFASARAAMVWAPSTNVVAHRLAKRCWPGPLTLVLGGDFRKGPFGKLPESVKSRVCPGDTLGLRVPDHPAALEILAEVGAPLVLSSANRSGEPAACTAEEFIVQLDEEIAVIVDAGPCRYGLPSTVVLIEDDSWRILRDGVLSECELREQAACRILFVCTGNTCRSPMAAALCKKLLAERLGCRAEELLERGFFVQSAGLTAMIGGEAAPEAVQAVAELGAGLAGHQAQPVTRDLVARADFLMVMTNLHLVLLEAYFPGVGPVPQLLSTAGDDIPDPIGCDQQVYDACGRMIESQLGHWIPRFVAPATEPACE